MGDGVDTLFNEDMKALSPGMPDFLATWEDALNSNEEETLEAYFPQHLEEYRDYV